MSLPTDVIAYLDSPTPAGRGFHQWILGAANKVCRKAERREAFEILARSGRIAGRLDPREINDALDKAYRDAGNFVPGAHNHGVPFVKEKKWPDRNPAAIAEIIKDGPGMSDLWDYSPVRWDDDEAHTEEIIDALFPADAWLCVGRHAKEFQTSTRDYLRGKLHKCSHIVPSPMDPLGGRAQAGHWSDKCNDAVERRRLLVIEFDKEERDNQASIIWHLAKFGALAMVVDSAGKSLHSWFYCQGSDESKGGKMHRFFSYAVSLGSDPAGWVLSQYMRMPDGTRDKDPNKGERQSVIYFNPAAISQ
jgi:hypothetical protein